MPNEISNALGTARQFTPKPDSLYQGRYRDMGVSQVHAGQSAWSTLADNMSKLNNALQSYAVSHEKYLDSTGLDKAQDLIKSKSPEDIEKLNIMDGAQTAGVIDVGSNPYFKAYAEKLRGNFLGARIKQNYDAEFADKPAKSVEDELKRFNEYVSNYRKGLNDTAPPSNIVAFDRGFYENSLTNATNLVGAYNKKKNEEYVINTVADITNEMGDLINDAPQLLALDNHSFSDKVREIFNAGRLMGLPAQYRQKLADDFTKRLIETGAIPYDRLKMMMDAVTVQTDMAGNEKKLSDIVDMNGLEETTLAYNLKYDKKRVDEFINKYGNTRQYDKFIAETDGLRYIDPKEYRFRMSIASQIHSRQQQREAEIKAEARARLAVANRANGSRGSTGGSNSKIADTDIMDKAIGAWCNGETYTPQYGTIGNMKFDEPLFTSRVMNELQYLASIGATTGITKLMSMPQVASVKKDIVSQINSSLASIHFDSGGNVVYDKNVENYLKWFQADPAGASFLYGDSASNEAQVICSLQTATGDMNTALSYYATWNTKSSEEKKNAKSSLQSYYDIDKGVENMRTGEMESVILTADPSLRETWKTLSAILIMRGADEISAQNTAGKKIAENLGYFRGAVFPKSVLNELGTGNDTKYFTLAIDALSNWQEDVNLSYDFTNQTFSCENLKTGEFTIRPLEALRETARSLAEQDGAKQAQQYADNNTTMTVAQINADRAGRNANSFDDLAYAESGMSSPDVNSDGLGLATDSNADESNAFNTAVHSVIDTVKGIFN